MGSFIPFLIVNGLVLSTQSQKNWLYHSENEHKELVQTKLPTKIPVLLTIENWMLLRVKTTSCYPSSIKCSNDWLDTSTTVLWTGYSGYNQIPIAAEDQEKTTFTCPFGTFTYWHMPFGLCSAPAIFQRCMLSFFSDMVEHFLEIFMDDFSIYGDSFDQCLHHLELILQNARRKTWLWIGKKCHSW